MVSRTPTMLRGDEVEYYGWNVYQVQVSKDDVVTLPEFKSSVTLSKAVLISEVNGAEITCTAALNVITVTGTATNVDCILFAFGVLSG